MKPKISLCTNDMTNPMLILGMNELLTYLAQSNLFEVSYHKNRIGTCKGDRGTIIYYNDKKIYLDLWDYASPTYSGEIFEANFDLLIKLQHPNLTFESFEQRCKEKSIFIQKTVEQRKKFFDKLTPWTFFPSRMMKKFIGKEDSIPVAPIDRHSFFCGKGWKCRGWYKQKIKEFGIEFIDSDQAFHDMEKYGKSVGKPLTDEQYINRMMSCKFGLVLHGRGSIVSEAKNRREIDYMMMKKPLLLNYKPNYYNPLVEGKHYIFFDNNTDLKNLESLYNINEIGTNGYQWYKENASPEGVAKTFLQIMNERGL